MKLPPPEIEQRAREAIKYLMSVGYGWGKYAASVSKQKVISEKQAQTLLGMQSRVKYRSKLYAKRDCYDGIDTDWAAEEYSGYSGNLNGDM